MGIQYITLEDQGFYNKFDRAGQGVKNAIGLYNMFKEGGTEDERRAKLKMDEEKQASDLDYRGKDYDIRKQDLGLRIKDQGMQDTLFNQGQSDRTKANNKEAWSMDPLNFNFEDAPLPTQGAPSGASIQTNPAQPPTGLDPAVKNRVVMSFADMSPEEQDMFAKKAQQAGVPFGDAVSTFNKTRQVMQAPSVPTAGDVSGAPNLRFIKNPDGTIKLDDKAADPALIPDGMKPKRVTVGGVTYESDDNGGVKNTKIPPGAVPIRSVVDGVTYEVPGASKSGGGSLKPSDIGHLADYSELVKISTDANKLIQDIPDSDIGPADSRIQKWGQLVGKNPSPEFTQAMSQYDAIRNQILKLRSGGAVTPQEADRLLDELGDPTSPQDVFRARIQNFTSRIQRDLNTRIEGMEDSGYRVPDSLKPGYTGKGNSEQAGTPPNGANQDEEAMAWARDVLAKDPNNKQALDIMQELATDYIRKTQPVNR